MKEIFNSDDLVAALDLPDTCRLNLRIPKKLLLENAVFSPADRKAISEGVVALFWLATLKPTTIGVPAYRESARDYQEIAVLHLSLRPQARIGRMVERVHRSVPYPVLLLTEQADCTQLSAVHIRRALQDPSRTVLDGKVVTVGSITDPDAPFLLDFRGSLALGNQRRMHMHQLYQSWIDALLALQTARILGNFSICATPERAREREEALREVARIGSMMTRLRSAARREKQIARQVQLNDELAQAQRELEMWKRRL